MNPADASERRKTALVIVDAQAGVLGATWDAARVVENIDRLVARARAEHVPIVWVQHDDDELRAGSDPWKFVPNFVPASTETVIHKHYNSSFANTDLDQRLRGMKVSRIVLAGALTNWCIRSTAYAALERGYDLALVADAHSTEPIKLENGQTIPAESIIAELNAVMQWVSVPNVKTEVKTTAAVAF